MQKSASCFRVSISDYEIRQKIEINVLLIPYFVRVNVWTLVVAKFSMQLCFVMKQRFLFIVPHTCNTMSPCGPPLSSSSAFLTVAHCTFRFKECSGKLTVFVIRLTLCTHFAQQGSCCSSLHDSCRSLQRDVFQFVCAHTHTAFIFKFNCSRGCSRRNTRKEIRADELSPTTQSFKQKVKSLHGPRPGTKM